MIVLKPWEVRRSGAHMTVTGRDNLGCPIRLTEVERIELVADGIRVIQGGIVVAQLASSLNAKSAA